MRVLLLLALVGAAFAAVPRSGKRLPERIVGGTATNVQQYPYMSNMQYQLWGIMWNQWCGGSLLTSTSVVSAAHCYEGDHHSQWRVRLGTSLASSGGVVIPAAQLILHQNYNPNTINNDIAIIKLVSPAPIDGLNIAVVAIASSNYYLADGTSVTNIGWGALSFGGSAPEQLQHVDINIVNQQVCAQRYSNLFGYPPVTNGMLCAGILDVGGKDACQGDSGGPLVYKAADQHVLVGVVSWGYQCAHAIYPGINTRISHYSDWVVANAS